jgi:Heavy metal associated domain 2
VRSNGGAPGTGRTVSVVHDMPGRLRLRLPSEANTEGLEDAVRDLPGVATCRWSPSTRSLLIHYVPSENTPEALAQSVAGHAGVPLRARSAVMRIDGRAGAARSPVAASIVESFGELNQRIARTTGGVVDLGLLVPVALTLWAARELVRGQMGPLAWSTALWYAHGLFRDYSMPDYRSMTGFQTVSGTPDTRT